VEVSASPQSDALWRHASGAFRDAASGRGSCIIVDGPAGSGKSALVEELELLARESGLQVLTAAGRPEETDLGFGVVVQLFEAKLEEADDAERAQPLSEAEREAAPIFAPGQRNFEPSLDTFHGIYRLCAKLARATPLAILVDDVDYADSESRRCLHYLVHRLEKHPAAVVLSVGSRPRTEVPELEAIAANPATLRVRIQPLSLAEASEPIRAQWSDATEAACARIHAASAGYPYLIDLMTAAETGAITDPDERIRTWTLRRAADVDERAPALLKAASVLGPDCEIRNAAALAALDAESAYRLAGRLVEIGILRREERLVFTQPAVADALAATQPPGERAAAHLGAARLASADEAPPEDVAAYLIHAARSGSTWVVDTLSEAAAIAIERGAPEDAVAYLRRALEEPPVGGRRAQVVFDLGRAEAIAGDPQAARHLGSAAELSDQVQEPASALATGRSLFALGWPGQAMVVFERALAACPDADSELAGRLRAGQAAAVWLSKLPEGNTLAGKAPPETADSPADRALLALHAIDGALRGAHCADVRELAVRALARGALLDDETADGFTYYLATAALAIAEDLRTAEAALTAAVEEAETRGSVLGFATASHARAMANLLRGRVKDAADDARRSIALERDGWRLGMGGARIVLAHTLVETGDHDAASRQIEEAEGLTEDTNPLRMALLLARGRIRLLDSDPGSALSDFVACGELCEAAAIRNPAVAPWRSAAGLASAAVGDRAEASRLINEELALAQAFGAPGPISRALRALATIHEPPGAIEALEAAVQVGEGSQASLERARALIEYGAALRRSSRRRDARLPLRVGLEIAQACGARVLAGHARREALSAGARPRRTALQGPESLTPRERQFAELAAKGFSNRAIAEEMVVTVKTVEWHLKHAYRKLGVGSRQALKPFFPNSGDH
jgi:DNA-binding CsgD family transcriptional regulator